MFCKLKRLIEEILISVTLHLYLRFIQTFRTLLLLFLSVYKRSFDHVRMLPLSSHLVSNFHGDTYLISVSTYKLRRLSAIYLYSLRKKFTKFIVKDIPTLKILNFSKYFTPLSLIIASCSVAITVISSTSAIH